MLKQIFPYPRFRLVAINSALFVVLLAFPAFGEGLRGYWGAGWSLKGDYHDSILPKGTLGGHVGMYRPIGDKGLAGMAFAAVIDKYGGYGISRFDKSWAFPLNLNLSALRFSSGQIGKGWFGRMDVGLSHMILKRWNGWSFTREGFKAFGGIFGWGGLIGGGYAWSPSLLLQVDMIVRHHAYRRPKTTWKTPYNHYAYAHWNISIGRLF